MLPPELRRAIKVHLGRAISTDNPGSRRGIASEADFPERLMQSIDWTGATDSFVNNLIDETLRWGDLSSNGSPALQAFLQATRDKRGEDGGRELDSILAELGPLLRGRASNPAVRSPYGRPFAQSDRQRIDWGGALRVEALYGRDAELRKLHDWLTTDGCKLVGVFGIGGVGKSALAVAAADKASTNFDCVIWQSLRNAPPVVEVLGQLVRFLLAAEHATGIGANGDVEYHISMLVDCIARQRCLIILDNFESVLDGNRAGQCLPGYEAYGTLLDRIGAGEHRSCLVVTSREKPEAIGRSQTPTGWVRALVVKGLTIESGRELLEKGGVRGLPTDYQNLIKAYSGIPLALKIVSEPIRELHDGDISRFLGSKDFRFSTIEDLIDKQLARLPRLERDIVRWLAIERDATPQETLGIDLQSASDLSENLLSLRRRSLIESSAEGYTLQNVILEHVTGRIVEQAAAEIQTEHPDLLESHALLKAQAREYVRESQTRLILQPLARKLEKSLGGSTVAAHLDAIIAKLRRSPTHGYSAGNVLNLLLHINADPSGRDFSGLTIREANLQGRELRRVSFASSTLDRCTFTAPFDRVVAVAFSSDNRLIAAGTANGDVRLWYASDGQAVFTFEGHCDLVWSVAFSPDGSVLATGSIDKTVRLWSTTTGQLMHVLEGNQDQVRAVAFSLDGRIVASGGADRIVRLWDTRTGEFLRALRGSDDWILALAFSPDLQTLVSGSQNGKLLRWNVATGTPLPTLCGTEKPIRSISISPDGELLAHGSDDLLVRIWDLKSGQCVKILEGSVWAVAFRPDGRTLATSNMRGEVRLWDLTSETSIALLGHSDWVRSIAFSGDGMQLVSGSDDLTVRLWDVESKQCVRALRGYNYLSYSLAFAHKGDLLASGEESNSIRLWNGREGHCTRVLRGDANRFRAIAFSPDDRFVAGASENETIELWDLHSNKPFVLRGHKNQVFALAFDSAGEELASGSSDQKILIWNVKQHRCVRELAGYPARIRAVAFGACDDSLACGGFDKDVWVWNHRTREVLRRLRGHDAAIWSLAYSVDGSLLASASDDYSVRLWDAQSEDCLQVLRGHEHGVHAVAFSPDGTHLATGSLDSTVRLWELTGGKWSLAQVLTNHKRPVRSIAFSSDGHRLASSSDDNKIAIVNVSNGILLHELMPERPYEGMDITSVRGITEAQKDMLVVLGAVTI